MSDPYAFSSTSAWALNIVSSVGIILANKEIMSAFGFIFPTTLVSIHLVSTAIIGAVVSFATSAENKTVLVPIWELIGFSLVSNGSLISMNISLMLNTVGFYQISKLSVIPATCALEWLLHGKTYSREVKLSTSVVMVGVGICTGSTLRVNNVPGLVAAAIAVFCTAMQQSLIGSLQRKHRLGSFPLLAQTASVQALSLLPFGPVVDYFLSNTAVTDYHLRPHAALFIALSCVLAMGCNLSQYLCINKSSAVTFQVLGTVKTILVIVLGALIFESPVSVRNICGMCIALGGMVMYSWAVERSKEGERGSPRVGQEQGEHSPGSKLMMSPLPSYASDAVKAGGEDGLSKSSLAV